MYLGFSMFPDSVLIKIKRDFKLGGNIGAVVISQL